LRNRRCGNCGNVKLGVALICKRLRRNIEADTVYVFIDTVVDFDFNVAGPGFGVDYFNFTVTGCLDVGNG